MTCQMHNQTVRGEEKKEISKKLVLSTTKPIVVPSFLFHYSRTSRDWRVKVRKKFVAWQTKHPFVYAYNNYLIFPHGMPWQLFWLHCKKNLKVLQRHLVQSLFIAIPCQSVTKPFKWLYPCNLWPFVKCEKKIIPIWTCSMIISLNAFHWGK